MDFLEAIAEQGFTLAKGRPARGARTYRASPNRFLTYWLYLYEDGSALLSWEFAVADYLFERGIQLGSAESLNLFMFPIQDHRGPQDSVWLTHAVDQTDAMLRGIDFGDPDA